MSNTESQSNAYMRRIKWAVIATILVLCTVVTLVIFITYSTNKKWNDKNALPNKQQGRPSTQPTKTKPQPVQNSTDTAINDNNDTATDENATKCPTSNNNQLVSDNSVDLDRSSIEYSNLDNCSLRPEQDSKGLKSITPNITPLKKFSNIKSKELHITPVTIYRTNNEENLNIIPIFRMQRKITKENTNTPHFNDRNKENIHILKDSTNQFQQNDNRGCKFGGISPIVQDGTQIGNNIDIFRKSKKNGFNNKENETSRHIKLSGCPDSKDASVTSAYSDYKAHSKNNDTKKVNIDPSKTINPSYNSPISGNNNDKTDLTIKEHNLYLNQQNSLLKTQIEELKSELNNANTLQQTTISNAFQYTNKKDQIAERERFLNTREILLEKQILNNKEFENVIIQKNHIVTNDRNDIDVEQRNINELKHKFNKIIGNLEIIVGEINEGMDELINTEGDELINERNEKEENMGDIITKFSTLKKILNEIKEKLNVREDKLMKLKGIIWDDTKDYEEKIHGNPSSNDSSFN